MVNMIFNQVKVTWTKLIAHTDHLKHFTVKPHLPIHTPIKTSVGNLESGALPRVTSTFDKRKPELNLHLFNCKIATLPTDHSTLNFFSDLVALLF